jgi:hypothetical protein
VKSKLLLPVGLAVAVTALVMNAEQESPGSTGRGVAELRQAVTPVAGQLVGTVGDGVLVVRDEAGRQGFAPGNIFVPPAPAPTGGLPDIDPNAANR